MNNIRLSDLMPNDVSSATAYYRQCLSDGTWDKDKAHSVLMLQDDPDELIAAMNKMRAAMGIPLASSGPSSGWPK